MKKFIYVLISLLCVISSCKKEEEKNETKKASSIVCVQGIELQSYSDTCRAYNVELQKVVGLNEEYDFAFIQYDTVGAIVGNGDYNIINTCINFYYYFPDCFLAGPNNTDLVRILKKHQTSNSRITFYSFENEDSASQKELFENANNPDLFGEAFEKARQVVNPDRSSDAIYDDSENTLMKNHLIGIKTVNGVRVLIWIDSRVRNAMVISVKYELFE
jgi:hypothetical protein